MRVHTDLRMMPAKKDVKLSSTIFRLIITSFFTITTFFITFYYWPAEAFSAMGGGGIVRVEQYQSLPFVIGFILLLFIVIFSIVFVSQMTWSWLKSRKKMNS